MRPLLRIWALQGGASGSPNLRAATTELLGHDPGPIELIRDGTNIVCKAEQSGMVFRLHRPDEHAQVRKNIELITRLKAAGAPVLTPVTTQAWHGPTAVITAWPLGKPIGSTADSQLAHSLGRLHTVSTPPGLAPMRVAEKLKRRLRALPADLPHWVTDSLASHSAEATDRLADVGHDHVVLHGDPHPGNLVVNDGHPALIDLDDLCVGPREFDLLPALVRYRRFHRDRSRWELFTRHYGSGPHWKQAEKLTVVREATMNTWLAGKWNHGARPREELMHRIATWDMEPMAHHPWSPL